MKKSLKKNSSCKSIILPFNFLSPTHSKSTSSKLILQSSSPSYLNPFNNINFQKKNHPVILPLINKSKKSPNPVTPNQETRLKSTDLEENSEKKNSEFSLNQIFKVQESTKSTKKACLPPLVASESVLKSNRNVTTPFFCVDLKRPSNDLFEKSEFRLNKTKIKKKIFSTMLKENISVEISFGL